MVMHWFPVNVNLVTARLFGTCWYYFDKKHRRGADEFAAVLSAFER